MRTDMGAHHDYRLRLPRFLERSKRLVVCARRDVGRFVGDEVMSDKKKLTLQFGAMAAPLIKQIHDQDLRLRTEISLELLNHCQQDVDAVNRLSIRGYFTDEQTSRCRLRILNRVRDLVI